MPAISGSGSPSGKLALSDWKKWGKAAGYLIVSSMLIGALNAGLQVVGMIDFSELVITIPFVGVPVNGSQIGLILTNLFLYLIELVGRNSQ